MDASRLLAVIFDIEAEFRKGFIEKLDAVIEQYSQARDTPAQDFSATIQKSIQELQTQVSSSVFVEYPPSKATILESIGGADRIGAGFLERLRTILSVAGQTTAGLVTNLTGLSDDLKKFQKGILATKNGLVAIGITPYILEIGKFEAGILIPGGLVDGKLGSLAKQFDQWNRIVRGIQEIAGDEIREVPIASLGKGFTFEVYLPLSMLAAGILAKIIGKIFEAYNIILELRDLRQKMEELGGPTTDIEKYKEHERVKLDKIINDLAKEIMAESPLKEGDSRKNELEAQLVLDIRQVAAFVDKGGIVEVYTPPAEEIPEPAMQPESEETGEGKKENARLLKEYETRKLDADNITKIREWGRSLWMMPEQTEAILQLPDSDFPAEPSPQEKASKRKATA